MAIVQFIIIIIIFVLCFLIACFYFHLADKQIEMEIKIERIYDMELRYLCLFARGQYDKTQSEAIYDYLFPNHKEENNRVINEMKEMGRNKQKDE